jgi:predicted ArsR family transcriptional regulator
VALLRKKSATVEELARALGLTANAIRAHLVTLERDGLVHVEGARPSRGKPAYSYALTSQAEGLFPKAYELVLRELLTELDELARPSEVNELARAVGRRVAAGRQEHGPVQARLEAAVTLLNDLGGLAEVEPHDGRFIIRGYSCPLAALLPDHPVVCTIAEAMLREVTGLMVRERCQKTDRPRCCFDVFLNGRTGAPRPVTRARRLWGDSTGGHSRVTSSRAR